MGSLDAAPIEILCDNYPTKCRRKTQKSLRWLKTHNELLCPCGARTDLRAAEFRRRLGEMERRLAKLMRQASKLGGTHKIDLKLR